MKKSLICLFGIMAVLIYTEVYDGHTRPIILTVLGIYSTAFVWAFIWTERPINRYRRRFVRHFLWFINLINFLMVPVLILTIRNLIQLCEKLSL